MSEHACLAVLEDARLIQSAVLQPHHLFQVGTPDYVAPEVLACKARKTSAGTIANASQHGYTTAADIWAVGVLVWELLAGTAPFSAKTVDEIKCNVRAGKLAAMPAWSEDCTHFVTACMTREPLKRPSAEALLSHPWIEQPS
jgi:serine/threonine protein kinase